MWEIQHKNADLDCFKTLILQETLKTRLVHFRKSHVRANKFNVQTQTSVSHSSTESEIISLGAGSRMDGIPAFDLWDLVIEVFHSSPNQTNKTKDDREPRRNLSAKNTTKHAETDSNHTQ